MKKSIIYLSLLAGVFLIGCNKVSDADKHPEEAITETVNNANKEVELNKAQYDAAGIELGALEQKNLTDVIKVNGYTKLPPQNQANVTTFLNGTITQILVNVGDKVSKGQVLAYADSPGYIQLQESYAVAKSNLEYLELEFKRQETLRAENVNSEKTFQKIKSDLNIEKSKFQSLSNQLRMLQSNAIQGGKALKIVAPISGYVATIGVQIGSPIQSEAALMTLVDNSKLHLDLMVYEKDLPQISIGQEVTFALTNLSQTVVSGKIFSIGKTFEEGTRSVAVHASIDNVPDNLIGGLYVNALIHIGSREVPALPEEAVVKAEGREFIFILEEADANHFHFKRIEVKTGIAELGFVQITLLDETVEPKNIVRKGAYYLQSHLIKNEGGGGHDH
ncbi:efflux RND transporter periplasmic adaptor subunit [Myroides guanonis]|uniref:Membrane fusion protein, cobalt-zinc-cadmium efflux system n=1 Tax=Myroides guanonis TaxID=1150112 RepID=A0A1I3Q4M0_9FLAO|nr:efflux RND transporter periplasmic adaptor subunit [Myroides guanonis]SFJ28086.1 membrane fusion protein, cobalt-zinc-cadmium efflux system [Myroides guanonis]